MAYKTILVLCDASDAAAARLAFAHRLAFTNNAHLIALYVPPVFMAPSTLIASLSIADLHRRHHEKARPNIEKTRALFGRIVKDAGLTSEWHALTRSPMGDAVELAKCADLVVVGQEERIPSANDLPRALPESLIMWSGRPVMVIPLASAAPRKLRKAVVCWDGTREAALSASQAMPLLEAAEDVDVLMVNPDRNSVGEPLTVGPDPIAWLGRHGVAATRHCRLMLSHDCE